MQTVEQRLDRIDKKLTTLLTKDNRKWVKVGAITELTGWDSKKLEWARLNEILDFKPVNGVMYYDLNSLPDQFVKK